jgi:Integrase zinc binding domain
MAVHHDHPSAGHPGYDKTIQQMRKYIHWPNMNQWITEYIKGCATCQQNKAITHPRRTPLFCIDVPSDAQPFTQVSMDLITRLPSSRGLDAILTIVDHGCSQVAIFLPCSTLIMGPGIAQLYLDNIYRWFGILMKLITDRDPQFMSHFGKALCTKLGIHQNLSTAFHPQTNGLCKKMNQWVEQYLQLVTSTQPKDWTNWLSVTSSVHNNRRNSTTGLSPNQILLRYETSLQPQDTPQSNNEMAQACIKQMTKY